MNKDGQWLLTLLKYGRIILYMALIYVLHLYVDDFVALLFCFGIIMSELWDIQASIIELEEAKKKGELSIGEFIKRSRNSTKR